MATEIEHRDQANHNQLFLDTIHRGLNWIVTAAFTKRCIVEMLLYGRISRVGVPPPKKHSQRRYPPFGKPAPLLFSRLTRYQCFQVSADHLQHVLRCLRKVEASVSAARKVNILVAHASPMVFDAVASPSWYSVGSFGRIVFLDRNRGRMTPSRPLHKRLAAACAASRLVVTFRGVLAASVLLAAAARQLARLAGASSGLVRASCWSAPSALSSFVAIRTLLQPLAARATRLARASGSSGASSAPRGSLRQVFACSSAALPCWRHC